MNIEKRHIFWFFAINLVAIFVVMVIESMVG